MTDEALVRGAQNGDVAGGWQPERRDLAQPGGAFARVALRLELHATTCRRFPERRRETHH